MGEEVAAIVFMGICILTPLLLSFFISMKEPITVVKYIYIEKNTSTTKHVQTQKPKEKDIKYSNPFIKDATDCLISLGMNKKLAKEKVDKMFSSKNYNSIEDFLLDVYKI